MKLNRATRLGELEALRFAIHHSMETNPEITDKIREESANNLQNLIWQAEAEEEEISSRIEALKELRWQVLNLGKGFAI